MDNRILKSKAVQKLETPNPSINLSAKRIMSALMTNKNKPNVKMVTGNVNMTKMGFTNKFRIAKTMATIKAPRYPSTETPLSK